MHGTVGDVSVEGRAVLTMAERDVGFREASIGVNGYGERGYVNACVTFPRGIESLPLQGRARVVGVDLWACAVDELEDSRYDVNAQSVEALVEPTEMGSNVTVFAELPNGDELEFSFHAWFHQRESSMGWAEPMLELADEPY